MLFSSALRPIATAVVGLSLCFGSAPAMANPCVAGMQGCVLPVPELPPAAAVESVAPIAEVAEVRRFNYLIPLLVGAAALVALLLLLDDDDEDEPEPEPEPVSP